MPQVFRVLIAATIITLLDGCALLNDVARIDDANVTSSKDHRAVAIFGIGVEGKWGYPQFSIGLDEYSVERQSITGDCWRYNTMKAAVPKESSVVRYFAFDVKPGYYAYSGFNALAVGIAGPSAFFVPVGQVTYLGDLIYVNEHKVILRRNLDAARTALTKTYPNLSGTINLAEVVSVTPPKIFLCAP